MSLDRKQKHLLDSLTPTAGMAKEEDWHGAMLK